MRKANPPFVYPVIVAYQTMAGDTRLRRREGGAQGALRQPRRPRGTPPR